MRLGRLLRRRSDEDLATWLRKATFRSQVALRNRWRRTQFQRRGPKPTTSVDVATTFGEASADALVARYLEQRPPALTAFGIPSPSVLEALRREEPASTAAVIGEAEELMRGRYRLFGEAYELGMEPDWSRDPIDGHRGTGFGPGLDVIRLGEPGEVRVLWELNRGHHLVRLAQARLLTGEPRFAKRALSLLEHWIRSNPLEEGPNWHCAMEAALRAVNWIWLYHLLHDTDAWTPRLLLRLLAALWDHGRFVAANLEGRPGLRNSNHYLADGLGLVYVGRFFEPAPAARRWARAGWRILWSELEKQVGRDGVSREMTTSYHRLVAEMYVHAWSLARQTGQSVPPGAGERIRAMIDFATHYVRPDGRAPAWGDQDDARVVPFAPAPPDDHGHLLQAGRTFLEMETGAPSSAGRFEATWLGGALPAPARAVAAGTRAFPEAGVFVLRHGGDYVLFDAGPHGTHGHSDALSFELYGNDRPLLVDTGTFCYTRSLEDRDACRGTAGHNTVTVNGLDSSALEANCLWGSRHAAEVRVRRFASDEARDVVEAEHDGFVRRLEGPLHRRRLTFEKAERMVVVVDTLEGSGAVEAEVHFHLGQDLEGEIGEESVRVRQTPSDVQLLVIRALAPGLEPVLEKGRISSRFGVWEEATVLRYRGRVTLPFGAVFALCLGQTEPSAARMTAALRPN